MITNASIDTNVLVRFILRDIPKLATAADNLLKTPNADFFISDIVFSEIEYVLTTHSGYTRSEVKVAFDLLLSLPNLHYNVELLDLIIPEYVAHPKLSFVDCCLAGYTKLGGYEPLWTFDKKLAKQSDVAKLV